MSLQQRRLTEEPRLAAAGTADHQNVFISGILRLLWTARHRNPFCLRHGDVLEKGCVYVAPGGKHMRITRNRDGRHVVTLSDEPAIGGLKPCADIMYESLRDCGYDEVTCVVLTGMGADGTKGILSLREKKDLYVISQSAETCVVYGMPKSIAETGVVDSVVPLAEVAQTIIKNVGVQ